MARDMSMATSRFVRTFIVLPNKLSLTAYDRIPMRKKHIALTHFRVLSPA